MRDGRVAGGEPFHYRPPVIELVAFDLDGVLYSSEPFLGEAYREAIAGVNAQRPGSFDRVPTTREILDHVGWPVSEIIARLFPQTDSEALALLYGQTLNTICRRVARGEGILYPGVADILPALAAARYRLAIASNGRRRYVEAVLHTYALTGYFEPLIAADDTPVRDKGQIVRAHQETDHLTAEQVVLVGDRTSDVEAAQAVGCHFVGCDYGHGYRHEIEPYGPIVASFRDLPSVLTTLCKLPTAR